MKSILVAGREYTPPSGKGTPQIIQDLKNTPSCIFGLEFFQKKKIMRREYGSLFGRGGQL